MQKNNSKIDLLNDVSSEKSVDLTLDDDETESYAYSALDYEGKKLCH